MKNRVKTKQIHTFIVDNLLDHESNIARLAAEHFQISRAAVARHIGLLVKANILRPSGKTKARTYELVPLIDQELTFQTNGLQEDVIWREYLSPLFPKDTPENVLTICDYGFTEMLNNAIDHSESDDVRVCLRIDAANIFIWVQDFGVGIFQKIMQELGLHDARHALLELSKGKLTTAASGHTGQGIFFTSRMFDEFIFWANGFSFHRSGKDDWLFEPKDGANLKKGTLVMMRISPRSAQIANNIFSQYSSELHDYGFTKTHVPLTLARYEGEQLVSRSQAKRLMLRVDQFKEVLLDFAGINTIGQAFAAQIFRVFKREHPSVRIFPINTNEAVEKMIERALNENFIEPTPSLFDSIKDEHES